MKKIIIISSVMLILVSCKKEASIENNKPSEKVTSLPISDTILISDTTIFYDCEFDGQRQLQIAGLNNCISMTGGTALPYVYNNYGQYTFDFFTDDSLSALTFRRSNINLLPNDTTYLLKNQRMFYGFAPNIYTFTQTLASNNGVIIERHDAAGTVWSTNLGIASQAGSSFQILKLLNLDKSYSTTGITHGIYLFCKFDCTLYDGSGKTMTITNGKMGIVIWL